MQKFITYELATGQATGWGYGPEGVGDLQRPPPGWAALELPGEVEIEDLADLSAFQEVIRLAVWRKAKRFRDKAIAAGAVTPAGTVQTDPGSLVNIIGAALAAKLADDAGDPFSIDWTMADNSVVTVNAAQMMTVGKLAFAHINSAHENARALRTAIEGAANVTALLQIDVAAGW